MFHLGPHTGLAPVLLFPEAALRIMRTHQRLQRALRNDPLHLVQKQLTAALPPVLLKPAMRRKALLPDRSTPHSYPINQSA